MVTLQVVLKSFQRASTCPACSERAATRSVKAVSAGPTEAPVSVGRPAGAGGEDGGVGEDVEAWLFAIELTRVIPDSSRSVRITRSPARKSSRPVTLSSSLRVR